MILLSWKSSTRLNMQSIMLVKVIGSSSNVLPYFWIFFLIFDAKIFLSVLENCFLVVVSVLLAETRFELAVLIAVSLLG